VVDRRGRLCRGDSLGGAGSPFPGATYAGWYEDLDRLIADSRRLRGVSAYVTINPVRPDLLARSDHALMRSRTTTRDADIACLRWLFLDIDPVRAADISSTDSELAAAIQRRNAILKTHPDLAISSMWGRSGNGAWILARLPDYPNDDPHRRLIAAATRTIAERFSDSQVVIDSSTTNPARLIGLPGTIKTKGSNRPERPWRLVTLDGVGRSIEGSSCLDAPILPEARSVHDSRFRAKARR
jgi:hypothetical protein